MVSFQESSQLLDELAGVDVGAKQVQRSAQALGEQVAGCERQIREPDSSLPLPSTLYLGLDGTGVPMRSTEVQGRSGKQPDGSARTREAKLCTVWSAEQRDAEGQPQRDPDSVTYTAAIESAATLARISQHRYDNRFFNSISVVLWPPEFESRPVGSNAAPKADIRRRPGAFSLPPALLSDVSPPKSRLQGRARPTDSQLDIFQWTGFR